MKSCAEYLASVAELPLPTAAQLVEFGAHLAWAHSWYKHLPLRAGGLFVVFLAPDAGGGFEGEGRVRLHYSWETTAEYRERFGYLDYAYRVEDEEPFLRDCGSSQIVEALPSSLREPLSLMLYPYVSTDFNAIEAISYGCHVDDLAALRAGAPHPERERVLAWADQHALSDETYARLDEAERELVRRVCEARDDTDAPLVELARARAPSPSAAVLWHLEVFDALEATYHALQRSEQERIERHLGRIPELYRSLRDP